MRQVTAAPAEHAPPRLDEWKGPTGRTLKPGRTFKIKGRSGDWEFIAYVEAEHPYVECKKANVNERSKGTANVRCVRPELVYEVSYDEDRERRS